MRKRIGVSILGIRNSILNHGARVTTPLLDRLLDTTTSYRRERNGYLGLQMVRLITDRERFLTTRVIGNIAKEIVRGLLDESGYRTYPYGYESFLSEIKYRVRKKGSEDTESMKRIRSHPDLVAYDDESGDIRIVEVKYRNASSLDAVGVSAKSVVWYKKYWNDSVLVIVVPIGKIFYAQHVSNLHLPEPDENPAPEILIPSDFVDFNLNSQFHPIAEVFQKVSENLIYDRYAKLAKGISKMEPKQWIVAEPE